MSDEIRFDDLQTSNELTPIYGRSPYEKIGKSDSDFQRGFVIYIGGFNPHIGNNRMINPRVVFHDYDSRGPYGIGSQDELEFEVLKLGRSGLLRAATKKSYPDVFSQNLGKIDYGYKPCIVTYILDVHNLEFQKQDGSGRPDSFNQPVVFRRNKVVVADDGTPASFRYLGNEQLTFSDLKHHQVEGASALIFYNNMLDQGGKPIEKPGGHDLPPLEYCMDMYIRTEQGKRLYAFTDAELESLKKGEGGALANNFGDPISQYLTMVFDPPHTNGGSDGPYP